jgi:chaperone BCS1
LIRKRRRKPKRCGYSRLFPRVISDSTLQKLERKEARLKAKKTAAATKSDSSVPADTTTESIAAAETPAADDPSSSSSESDTTTGTEADTEESVTSEEEESDKADNPAKDGAKKEKWVAVKSQTPAADPQPEATEETTPS